MHVEIESNKRKYFILALVIKALLTIKLKSGADCGQFTSTGPHPERVSDYNDNDLLEDSGLLHPATHPLGNRGLEIIEHLLPCC